MAKLILQSITAIGFQGKEPSLQAGVVKEIFVEDTAGSERMPNIGIVLGEGKGIPDGGNSVSIGTEARKCWESTRGEDSKHEV